MTSSTQARHDVPTPIKGSPLDRLTTLWYKAWEKDPVRIKQINMAKYADWNQSTVSQYLTGRIPLNTDAKVKFAGFLQVEPRAIDNKLAKFLTLTPYARRRIRVVTKNPMKSKLAERPLGTESLNELPASRKHVKAAASSNEVHAVLIDSNLFTPRVNEGDYVTFSTTATPKLGKLVLVWSYEGDFTIGHLKARDREAVVLSMPGKPDTIVGNVEDVFLVESIIIDPELTYLGLE